MDVLDTLSAVLGIVLIDLVLSGDNAIVIGMAAHRLPPAQRRLAIAGGGAAAVALRIALTAVAALLLTLPGLQALGGLLLLWIAFRLLQADEPHAGRAPAVTLREAMLTILLADVVMSLDNILGVAAAAHGNLGLLLLGLAFSVSILMLGGSLVAALINRLWWLAYLGAAVIAWTGAEMALADPLVARLISPPEELSLAITAAAAAATVALAHWLHRQRRMAA